MHTVIWPLKGYEHFIRRYYRIRTQWFQAYGKLLMKHSVYLVVHTVTQWTPKTRINSASQIQGVAERRMSERYQIQHHLFCCMLRGSLDSHVDKLLEVAPTLLGAAGLMTIPEGSSQIHLHFSIAISFLCMVIWLPLSIWKSPCCDTNYHARFDVGS